MKASPKEHAMTSWKEFAQQAPEFAEFGRSRFKSGVGYLGTIRPDGSPRVHPVSPIIGDTLFLFMEPTSPKGKDLLRDPRYTLHCSVEDSTGGGGEFYIRGHATFSEDPAVRKEAVRAAFYTPKDRYIVFTFSIEFAFMNTYIDGEPHPRQWRASE
jgi:hypothetical protein